MSELINNNSYDLLELGDAMFALYDGMELSIRQIDLIVNSSASDKIVGMNLAASDRLLLKYNSSTYDTNINIIYERQLLKRKKGR